MVIESIKTLGDLVVTLLKEVALGKQKVFENYHKPLYEGAKKVFDDYLALFAEAKKLARDNSSLDSLANFLDERRHVTLSLRHQLRAFIQQTERALLPTFERSILGILEGAFSVAHSVGHFRAGIHEQMAREELCRRAGKRQPSRSEFLDRFIREIDGQVNYLEFQFRKVADEYAALQAKQSTRRTSKKTKSDLK